MDMNDWSYWQGSNSNSNSNGTDSVAYVAYNDDPHLVNSTANTSHNHNTNSNEEVKMPRKVSQKQETPTEVFQKEFIDILFESCTLENKEKLISEVKKSKLFMEKVLPLLYSSTRYISVPSALLAKNDIIKQKCNVLSEEKKLITASSCFTTLVMNTSKCYETVQHPSNFIAIIGITAVKEAFRGSAISVSKYLKEILLDLVVTDKASSSIMEGQVNHTKLEAIMKLIPEEAKDLTFKRKVFISHRNKALLVTETNAKIYIGTMELSTNQTWELLRFFVSKHMYNFLDKFFYTYEVVNVLVDDHDSFKTLTIEDLGLCFPRNLVEALALSDPEKTYNFDLTTHLIVCTVYQKQLKRIYDTLHKSWKRDYERRDRKRLNLLAGLLK